MTDPDSRISTRGAAHAATASGTVRRSPSATSATDIHHSTVGLWAWTRPLDPCVAAYAESVADGCAFGVRGEAAIDERDARVGLLLEQAGLEASSARQMLASDIAALAFLYARTAGTDRVLLRLEAGRERRCPLLHVDHVALRLVCTYGGPGTEWLDDEDRRIRRLRAGWVSLLKGRLYPDADAAHVAHRSPPASAGSRLVLVIDATD